MNSIALVDEEDVVAGLRRIVGAPHVVTDPEVLAQYEVDWTGRYQGRCEAVVRPGTTEEVARVVAFCADRLVPIVPQGGNTGLVGGSVPRGGEVVLSLRRLTRIEPIDPASAQVTVGAGVVLSTLQRHAQEAGFQVGVDFAARDSATLGGIVATNAGGERVLRYGMARSQVTGLEVVLPDGSVMTRLSGLVKDNGGYDLPMMIVGSEGTLGVITAIRLRLFPLMPHRGTALLALADTAGAVTAVSRLRRAMSTLEAAEVFYANGLELVCQEMHLPRPMPGQPPVYLLVECAGRRPILDDLLAVLESLPDLLDAVIAESGAARARLWEYRESHTLALAARGIPLKLDVAVPLAMLAAFEAQLTTMIAEGAPAADLVLFGHLAEGNLHINILGVGEEERELVTGQVLGLVRDVGGSVCAEHGVGVAKAGWLELSRSEDELRAMRRIKEAFDPKGLFNPGVLFAQ